MSWWITGFDGGEKAILGISTDVADYYLMKPSAKYEPFLKEAHHKMYMVKLVIEFLKESEDYDATYDNLLYKLQVRCTTFVLSLLFFVILLSILCRNNNLVFYTRRLLRIDYRTATRI